MVKEVKSKSLEYIILSIISLFFFFLGKDTGIFWDNVIFVGKMGNHLFQNGIFSWDFPNSFDPGHPPFLAFLLALGWIILGKSLLVSHLLLLPFIYGLFLQLFKLTSHFFEDSINKWLVFLMIICEPTLSTHLTIINPEIFILFFFFLGLNALINKNHVLKVIAIGFLGITSLRGMLVCSGFFLFECFYHYQNNGLFNKDKIKQILIQYSISAIPAITFILGRLYFKGWISSHPDFPWLEFRQVVNIKEFIRNIIVLTHRFLDFGKFPIILFTLFILIKLKLKLDIKSKIILAFSILPILPIIITSLREVNPMGHRYFLISFVGLIIFVCYFIFNSKLKRVKTIYTLLLATLITGNLWIYPKHIAQGWDASLAHLPYYKLRKEAINYLDDNNISISEVTTFSPNATTIDFVDLNNDNREFLPFNINSKYVLTSTVFNLSDSEIELTEKNYTLLKSFHKNRIQVDILLRK